MKQLTMFKKAAPRLSRAMRVAIILAASIVITAGEVIVLVPSTTRSTDSRVLAVNAAKEIRQANC